MRKIVLNLHVRAISMRATHGILACGEMRLPCTLGRSGRSLLKREGDGSTPAGRWSLRQAYWRGDRGFPPRSRLPRLLLAPGLGWCDAAGDRNYNRPVRLPYPASHEEMARADGLYDVVVTLSHNERPRVTGLGSAVFFHLEGLRRDPTAGCVAVSGSDMRKILSRCGPATRLVVWPVNALRKGDGRRLPTRPAHGSRRS